MEGIGVLATLPLLLAASVVGILMLLTGLIQLTTGILDKDERALRVAAWFFLTLSILVGIIYLGAWLHENS